MKSFSLRTSALALLATSLFACFFLTACLNSEPEDEHEEEHAEGLVTVNIVDSVSGQPLGADTVYWSYQADGHETSKVTHGSDTTMKAATRLNVAGTQWEVRYHGLHGAVYLRARYEQSLSDTLCAEIASKTQLIQADTLPKAVTIALKVSTVCI